ncbi:hypothetical protein [Streptomyces sp. Act143]|uniref:hypothetical protein n=1 Tax=Streptomyces sp. Act143 TaxID=2200760 RepID=UPI0011B5E4C8|nr:hypothetical protein [Streptomyces sp. Act143]
MARQFAPIADAALDLLLRIAAAAHGLAVFLRQGLWRERRWDSFCLVTPNWQFGTGSAALWDTEAKAARSAREIMGQNAVP